MYKLYCYGDIGDNDGYYEIEREDLCDIIKHIEENTWYADYRDNYKSAHRSTFRVIRLTQYEETDIMSAIDPRMVEIISNAKEKFEKKQVEENEKRLNKQKEQDLKTIAELKIKYNIS